VITANRVTKKLIPSKRPRFFMTRLPRNTASYCRVPSATYADPAESCGGGA
jgi:hypothetical protein